MDAHLALLTGATGSFGHAMIRFLLDHTTMTIRAYSRDEFKQAVMRETFRFYADRLRWFIGDVRDIARLRLAMQGVDIVWHAAALKHVPTGQYNPSEMFATNVVGTQNVLIAAREAYVQSVVFLSSDKSVYPINIYGSTKNIAEYLAIHANTYSPTGTQYSAIRYGNVRDSRGSVLDIWRHALAKGAPLPLTHAAMTRFDLSLADAVQLAWFAALQAPRGSVLVPHLPAYHVQALGEALAAEAGIPACNVTWQAIGQRPGEKFHETLLTDDEAARVKTWYENETTPRYYCIPPVAPSWSMAACGLWQDRPLAESYSSDTWPWRLSVEDLRQRLIQAGV